MMGTLFGGFFKKRSVQVQDAPSKFLMEDKNKMVEVNMKEEDSFIDINCKNLTYAEVAAMSCSNETIKPIPKAGIRRKSSTRISRNTFAVLDEEPCLETELDFPEGLEESCYILRRHDPQSKMKNKYYKARSKSNK